MGVADGWLATKYSILGEHADAALLSARLQGNAALGQAGAANRQAGVGEGRMDSQNFRDRAEGQAALNSSAGLGALRGAQAGAYDADAARARGGLPDSGWSLGPNGEIVPNTGYAKGTANVPASPAEIDFFHQHLKAQRAPLGASSYAGGANKVPGKGPSTVDTVPAMLAPREAVLNEHAADLIGRDNIAAANAIGVAHQKAQGKGMVSPKGRQRGFSEGTPSVPESSDPRYGFVGDWTKGSSPQQGAGDGSRVMNQKAGPWSSPQPKPQKMSGGTHMVGHGKSAKTPTKIDPQALLSLMGAMQGGQAGGPPQAPMQGPGGMV